MRTSLEPLLPAFHYFVAELIHESTATIEPISYVLPILFPAKIHCFVQCKTTAPESAVQVTGKLNAITKNTVRQNV